MRKCRSAFLLLATLFVSSCDNTGNTFNLSPLVGQWQEGSAVPCDESEVVDSDGFGELIFKANGEFSMTWFPFEIYRDYWGVYSYDATTGELSMSITGGNYIPTSVDLEGSVEIQADQTIRLNDIYFGPPARDANAAPTCGYVIIH